MSGNNKQLEPLIMITKSHNHDHFWIEDGFLYESYRTIRGLRFREIIAVGNMPDDDVCREISMTYIAKEYLPKPVKT